MEWLIIGGAIILGLFLIVLEVYLIPGTTIVMFVGLVSIAYGVVRTFDEFGSGTGSIVLAGSIVATGFLFYLMVKTGSLNKFILKEQTVDSPETKTSSDRTFLVGKSGIAITPLKPSGRIKIDEIEYDALSINIWIEKDELIQVKQVEGNNIKVIKKEI